VKESIQGRVFLQLWDMYHWKMIPNCTGRYTCRDHTMVSTVSPQTLVQTAITAVSQEATAAVKDGSISDSNSSLPRCYTFLSKDLGRGNSRPDDILVIPLDEEHSTGIISYRKLPSKKDNTHDDDDSSCTLNMQSLQYTYVHTLNTKSGFQRKLEAMGIHNLCVGGDWDTAPNV
jgi:hypothetical protein